MPTLALIDGNSIAYRAFYALPEDLATKSGQVTNAVFGFTRMLIRLLKDYHPDGIAVAWDVSRQTFRTESYPEYKAQREKAPDHFRSQLPLMDEVLQTLDITQLREEGFEADDIIATLTRNGTAAGWEILIVTGDRDAFQLIEKTVKVVYTRRGISDIVLADEGYVEEKYGIRARPVRGVRRAQGRHVGQPPRRAWCWGEDRITPDRRAWRSRQSLPVRDRPDAKAQGEPVCASGAGVPQQGAHAAGR